MGDSTSIPSNWCVDQFTQLIEVCSNHNKVQKTFYKDKGMFPIVDQGQEFIAGYTDDSSQLYSEKLPVIIFGDHTRIIKYVDFQFATGADGVQLIRPKCSKLDSKFFYYALCNIPIRNEGYARHYKLLKETNIVYPSSLEEQKKIAAILSSVDDAIQAMQAVIDQTRRVKQGLLQQLLTRGIGHTRFKQTEIGDIPETWKVTTTGQICTSIVPGRDKPKCFNGDIPWLTISDIDGLKVNESKSGLKVTKQELQRVNGKIVPKDAVLMTCVGTFGIVAVAGRELVMNQQLHGFVCGSEALPLYLCLVLQTKESEMKTISGQTTIPYLNKAKCESIRVPLPPIIEQNQIVDKIVSIEENINANKKYLDSLSSLKRGLMQDLLTGRMRVGGST